MKHLAAACALLALSPVTLAQPLTSITGTLVGTGSTGTGQTSRIQLDTTGDGNADTTVVVESPNENLTDRIQDAIDNGFIEIEVIDSDGDGKLDADEEIVFEDPGN